MGVESTIFLDRSFNISRSLYPSRSSHKNDKHFRYVIRRPQQFSIITRQVKGLTPQQIRKRADLLPTTRKQAVGE